MQENKTIQIAGFDIEESMIDEFIWSNIDTEVKGKPRNELILKKEFQFKKGFLIKTLKSRMVTNFLLKIDPTTKLHILPAMAEGMHKRQEQLKENHAEAVGVKFCFEAFKISEDEYHFSFAEHPYFENDGNIIMPFNLTGLGLEEDANGKMKIAEGKEGLMLADLQAYDLVKSELSKLGEIMKAKKESKKELEESKNVIDGEKK